MSGSQQVIPCHLRKRRQTPGACLWLQSYHHGFSLKWEKKTYPFHPMKFTRKTTLGYCQTFWGFLWNTEAEKHYSYGTEQVTNYLSKRPLWLLLSLANPIKSGRFDCMFSERRKQPCICRLMRGNLQVFQVTGDGSGGRRKERELHSVNVHEFV